MTDKDQEEIFKNWLNHHKGLIFKIVRAYALSAEDRDDLFQEISLQVWRSVPNFRNESAVTTWLYRIALNTALRWKGKELKQVLAKDHTYLPILHDDPSSADDRIDWLYAEIAKLSEIDKSLCLLLLDGFSYKEMADIVGITESNVAVKIHRIKKFLEEQGQKKKYHYEN